MEVDSLTFPTASAAAKHIYGRIRLPPLNTEYRIASKRVEAGPSAMGKQVSRR